MTEFFAQCASAASGALRSILEGMEVDRKPLRFFAEELLRLVHYSGVNGLPVESSGLSLTSRELCFEVMVEMGEGDADPLVWVLQVHYQLSYLSTGATLMKDDLERLCKICTEFGLNTFKKSSGPLGLGEKSLSDLVRLFETEEEA